MTLLARWGPDNFIGLTGAPVPGLAVEIRLPGTTTKANLFTTSAGSVAAANPVIADDIGNASFYAAAGLYDFFAAGRTIASVPVWPHPTDLAVLVSEKSTFNVRSSLYGATGDGVTNDVPAMQAALNAARLAGGGLVIVPPGTYSGSLAAHPLDASKHAMLVIGAHTTLYLMPGATVKLANGQSIGTSADALVLNYNLDGGDEGISIIGGTFDANAANQTMIHNGIRLWRTRGSRLRDVTVINCRGTSGVPPNETFHIDLVLGLDAVVESCTVAGIDGGSHATGFSNNGSVGTRLNNCTAWGMTLGHGYTHNACTDLAYNACRAYLNGNGFNHEISDGVTYTACVAGGVVIEGSGGPWPYAAGTSLGNIGWGYILNGTSGAVAGSATLRGVHLDDCIGDRNGAAGAMVTNATADTYAVINGGAFTNNGGGLGDIDVQNGAQATMRFGAMPRLDTGINHPVHGLYVPPGRLPNTPTIGASNAYVTNDYPFPVDVYLKVTGGSVTATYIDADIDIGVHQLVRLRPQQRVAWTYTGTGSYQWFVSG